jgi:hypothetical protein
LYFLIRAKPYIDLKMRHLDSMKGNNNKNKML